MKILDTGYLSQNSQLNTPIRSKGKYSHILNEILDVNGLDAILIGPYDLSASMGYPGEFDRAEVEEALKRVDTICLDKGLPLGFHVISSDHTKTLEKIKVGYTFLAVSLDFFFLGDSARREMSELRKATKS